MNSKSGNLQCDICSINFMTIHEKEEHEFSLMHHIRLDQREKNRPAVHKCTLCQVPLTSLKCYVSHLEGKKHKTHLSDYRKRVQESIEKEKENNIAKKKQSVKNFVSTNRKVKHKLNNENTTNNSEIKTPCKKSEQMEKYTLYPESCNQQKYDEMQNHNYYGKDNFSSGDFDFMSKGNFHSPDKQNVGYQNSFTEADHWNYQSWNTRYFYQQWNGQFSNRSSSHQSDEYYNNSSGRNFNSYSDNSNTDKFNNSSVENNNNNYCRQQNVRYGKLRSQSKHNLTFNKYKYVKSNIKSYKNTCFEKKIKQKYGINNQERGYVDNTRAKGTFPKQKLLNINSGAKLNTQFPNQFISSSNKNSQNSNVKVRNIEIEPSKSTSHIRFNDLDDTVVNVFEDKEVNENFEIQNSDEKNGKKTESDELLIKRNQNNSVQQTDKVEILSSHIKNENGGLEKSNLSEEENKNSTDKNSPNIEQDTTNCTGKLYKLSQLIEKSEMEIGAYNKELINRLVNFPRSRKEQIRLEQWIKQHIKTKKRLTLPRFNLQLGPSENSKEKNKNSPSILHSMVSEVVNSLPENVLNSVVSALKNGEIENIEQNVQNDGKKFKNNSNQTSVLQKKISCDSINITELTYNDKLKWLENWITYNLPRTEENVIIKTEASQSTENDSDQDNEFSKECTQPEKVSQVKDSCIIKVKEERKSDDESTSTVNFEDSVNMSGVTENIENDTNFSDVSPVTKDSGTIPSENDNLSSSLSSDQNNNLNLSDIRIKTEPVDLEEEINENIKSDVGNIPNSFDALNRNFTSLPQSVEMNAFNEPSNISHSPSLSNMVNVEDILRKSGLLQPQTPERTNVSNGNQSKVTSGSSSQTLIQEILAISQKEEEIRIQAQKIDQSIIYLMKLIEEEKKKRTQLFHEEEQLRSQRIQLLQTLQEMQDNQEGFQAENVPSHTENMNSSNETVTPTYSNLADNSYPTLSTDNNEGSFTFMTSQSTVQSTDSKTEVQRIEKIKDKVKIQESEKNVVNKIKMDIPRKRVLSSEESFKSMEGNVYLENNNNKSKEGLSAKKLKFNENAASPEIILMENQSENPFINYNNKMQQFSFCEKENIEKCSNSSNCETTKENCKKNLENLGSSYSNNDHLSESKHYDLCNDSKSVLFSQAKNNEIDKLEAHNSSIVDIKVHDGYLYTCSSDRTAKKFDLKNLNNVLSFVGHQKTLSSIHITKFGDEKQVFTSSMDGCLRCFNDLNGQCLQVVEVNSPILCVAKGWDRLYLGLHSGKVSVFSLTTKRIIDVIHCAECAISCIATAAEGAQKILCIASYDTALTVRDAQSGLLLRCLEGQIKPPCSIRISANIVYTSTTERTLLIHNLSSGKLQKVLNWPSSATGLHIMPKFILSCSFDGLVRCYTKENWMLHAMYYGASKSSVLCMYVHEDWVFTGNRKGIIEAFKFNPRCVMPCQFGKCYFRFGRLEDLEFHIKSDHFASINSRLKSCSWRGCVEQFPTQSDEEKRNHILQHAETNSILSVTCI